MEHSNTARLRSSRSRSRTPQNLTPIPKSFSSEDSDNIFSSTKILRTRTVHTRNRTSDYSSEDLSPESHTERSGINNHGFTAFGQTEVTSTGGNSSSRKNVYQAGSNNGFSSPSTEHPAYKEYHDAGEYWNKFPKTDYTYSKRSPHRREIANGYVAMPNMSRRSLSGYSERVASFTNSNNINFEKYRQTHVHTSQTDVNKVKRKLQSFLGSDEIDNYRNERYIQHHVDKKWYQLIWIRILSVTTWFRNLFTRNVDANASVYRTPLRSSFQSTEQKSLFSRITSRLTLAGLHVMSWIYWLMGTVLLIDCTLLRWRGDSSSGSVAPRPSSKLLLLLVLIPLAILGVWWLFSLQQDDVQNALNYTAELASSVPSTIKDSLYNIPANISDTILYIPNQFYKFIVSGLAYVGEIPSVLGNIILNLSTNVLNFVSAQAVSTSSSVTQFLSEIFPFLLRSLTALFSFLYSGIISVFSLAGSGLLTYLAALFNTSSPVPYSESIQTISSQSLNKDSNLYIKKHPNLNINELSEAQISQITEMVLRNIQNKEILELIVEQKIDDNILSGKYKAQIENIVQNNYNININNNVDTLLREILKNDDLSALINSKIDDKLNNNQIFNEIETKLLELSNNNNILGSRIKILEERNIEFNNYIKNLGYDGGLDFKTWILQHFVEDKDNLINLINELRMNTSLDIEKLKNEQHSILANLKNEFSNTNMQNGDFSYAAIRKIVGDAIALYDADKTGLVDYALESGGGHVVSTRCTESYNARTSQYIWYGIPLWYNTNSPRTAITPNVAPGQCWAFQGFPGYLVIKLSMPIKVSGFTIEHISAKIVANGNIDSAPKNFSVWGLLTEKDEDPLLFGRYTYMDNTTTLQYFPVDNYLENEQLYQFVELRIESNHGNQVYTCLYRFRVHGYPDV